MGPPDKVISFWNSFLKKNRFVPRVVGHLLSSLYFLFCNQALFDWQYNFYQELSFTRGHSENQYTISL